MKIDRIKYEQGTKIGEFHESTGAEASVEKSESPEVALVALRDWVNREFAENLLETLSSEVKRLQEEAITWEARIENAKKRWEILKAFLAKHGVDSDAAGNVVPE